jgi:hypothetical protein
MDWKAKDLQEAEWWAKAGYYYDPAAKVIYIAKGSTTELGSLPSPAAEGYGWGYLPGVAKNGSYYGEISEKTGRPRTEYVQGYYRRDGTYVGSYYRSARR